MSATRDLIAAALTVRDVIQRGSVPEVYAAVKDLRELCARAMRAGDVRAGHGRAGHGRGGAVSDQCDCEIPLYYCTDRPDCRMVALVASKTPDEIATLRDEIERLRAQVSELEASPMSEEALDILRSENERLTACLRYEQHRAERIGTHGPHCKNWGPAHYECAMSALTAAEARADETRRLYNELLHQVGMKYPGETRHETAIRYLRLAEIHVCGPADAALRGEVKP